MAKKLVEQEVLNKTYKAIETHIHLLREFDVFLGNEYQKNRLETSIDYLTESMSLLKPVEDDIKELKKKAYKLYREAKETLAVYKASGKRDIEKIKELQNDIDLKLKLYIAYKG